MVFPVTPSGRCLSDSKTLGDFTTFEVKEKKNLDRTVSAASAWFEGFSVRHILFTVSLCGRFEHAEIIVFTTNQSFIK